MLVEHGLHLDQRITAYISNCKVCGQPCSSHYPEDRWLVGDADASHSPYNYPIEVFRPKLLGLHTSELKSMYTSVASHGYVS